MRDTNGNGTLDETLYAIQDANFNVVAAVDESGAVQERYVYDSYGHRTIKLGNWSNPSSTYTDLEWEILYAGYRYDSGTGLYCVRFRYYHAELGRWLQRDPIEYTAGSMNLYEYVSSGAVSALDPLGLISIDKSKEIRQGFSIWSIVDGIIPFGSPFGDSGVYDKDEVANLYGEYWSAIAGSSVFTYIVGRMIQRSSMATVYKTLNPVGQWLFRKYMASQLTDVFGMLAQRFSHIPKVAVVARVSGVAFMLYGFYEFMHSTYNVIRRLPDFLSDMLEYWRQQTVSQKQGVVPETDLKEKRIPKYGHGTWMTWFPLTWPAIIADKNKYGFHLAGYGYVKYGLMIVDVFVRQKTTMSMGNSGVGVVLIKMGIEYVVNKEVLFSCGDSGGGYKL